MLGSPVAGILDRLSHLRWRKLSILFAFLATTVSLFLYWYHPLFVDRIDERSRDIIFAISESSDPSSQVAMVVIDEKSIKRFGRWPWPRSLQAEVIEKLKSSEAKVVALDIVYISPTDEDEDESLRESLAAQGAPLVGGYFFRDEETFQVEAESLDVLSRNKISVVIKDINATQNLPQFYYVEPTNFVFSRLMQAQGFFNYTPDDDGIVRESQFVIQFGGQYYPSLALQALSYYWGEKPTLRLDDRYSIDVRVGEKTVELNDRGQLALNFYRGSKPFSIFSAADVIESDFDLTQLKNKIVFVGVTETGVADVRPTPVHPSFPGVALHATAVSNILQDNYLIRDKRVVFVDVLLMLVLPFLLVFLTARIKSLIGQIALGLVFFAVVWVFYYNIVLTTGYLVSIAYPVLAMVIGYLSYQSFHNFVSNRHAKFLKNAFANYVSAELVDQIIQSPEKLKLAGEKREITVLFCDLRDFTSISEKLDPEQLVSIMNDYFEPMTNIILEHGGTLDKYIGDAIMAIFNAPLDLPDHGYRAVQCAVAMQRKLSEINEHLYERYGVYLSFGIGINTGIAVVGNMGSSKRFDYTAMGDAVNLASRIESQCKNYGVSLLFTDSTRRVLPSNFSCRKVDTVRVKGKQEAVEVYTLEPMES